MIPKVVPFIPCTKRSGVRFADRLVNPRKVIWSKVAMLSKIEMFGLLNFFFLFILFAEVGERDEHQEQKFPI
jgi:hypothetical protein